MHKKVKIPASLCQVMHLQLLFVGMNMTRMRKGGNRSMASNFDYDLLFAYSQVVAIYGMTYTKI